ncbi:BREX-1 system adenine-specific DNA-methyltransferase PglX [Lactiplantibacillus plantarum]|uniref:BREX-1 system adenine-specific DNA-methyltransferase PglX n=2 Tax=Lactiplantibacillus plantarum TaxID=1590 RepID=UPI0021A711E3|nr:BREX-1 system adenine-specific DNA-methyltransferase PglX [Lactiplantibacillus plantarum]MCT3232449.1 BREX-1 system adenine-specific DNA-methyltransferase PglX [Lactiplantibacillus plantarum]MCT3550894.1 BREX-1 system adenine-specific DNA-methyltransferase PglX [Lactiplantibacillus plantarum]
MDKTAIKNFAIESRRKLIAAIKLQMKVLGITEEQISDKLETSTSEIEYYVDDRNPITGSNIVKRQKLVVELHERETATDYETAYNELVEEVAYTWFNRLIAIRFMEVNGYLPSRIRVLSSSSGRNEPDIMLRSEADLVPYLGAFSNEEQAIMVHASETEATVDMDAKYRMLFIKQANALNANLPHLFEKTNDYAELLFTPNYHVGVIQHLINDIDEADFDVTRGGQVEIIGWLYQYYNTEPKEVAISQPKSHKFRNNEIASATQIFTPDWIVKYMVQNSLGKLWIRHIVAKNGSLSEKQLAEQFQWQYYMEDGPQPKEAIVEITSTENSLEDLNIQDIKFIDPAMGSGHILVYAFDVLMDIYISEGFSKREATELIITNNLSGLDIDMRAFQLSYFSVMMKARQYNRRILSVNHSINVFSIPDTSDLAIESFNVLFEQLTEKTVAILKELLAIFVHGSEFGSLLKVGQYNFEMILSELDGLNEHQLSFELIPLIEKSKEIIKAAKLLAQPYHVVITNPPYMGSSRMSPALAKFAKEVYPNSKSDLFSMFMERWGSATLSGGYSCMVTMQSWMFLSSFEKMRKNILTKYTISNLMHMENNVMGIAFGTAVTILRNTLLPDFSGTYHQIKTTDVTKGIPAVVPITGNRFNRTNQANFKKIPGSPIAYWASENLIHDFEIGTPLKRIATPRQGLATADNNRFLRQWYEVVNQAICFDAHSISESIMSEKKWFPCNKGGSFRKWYGNYDYVVNWQNNGYEIRNFKTPSGKVRSRPQNTEYYFREAVTWSKITSGKFNVRYRIQGSIPETAGNEAFSSDHVALIKIVGLLNTKIVDSIMACLNPTINSQAGDFGNIPILLNDSNRVLNLAKKNIKIAQSDWDTIEQSWNFKVYPLLLHIADDKQTEVGGRLENAFAIWKTEAQDRFDQLKANEEELNRIFIDLYGLNDELTPEVEDKEVSVRRADEERDIKSLLSYFIGLVFGRYSLDTPGLAYAGGEWNTDKYQKFVPNKDNLLLLNDDRYFDDDRDIMNRFRTFLAVTFGEEHVQENMDYIAYVIGKKADNSEQAIRKYFVDDFFKDHKKGYQKRPIYWEFNSGKQNGLKALMYLHRYDEGELAMMRTDYMYPLQSRYEERIEKLQQWVQDESVTKTKKQLEKKLKHVTQQLKELKQYDPIVRHVADQRINLDLDDGVLVNYEKLQDGNKILSKI